MEGYSGAVQMAVPEQIVFPGAIANNGVFAIVIHKTGDTGNAPTAQNVASYFGNLSQNTQWKSSHYIVGKDGTIVQCVDERDGAGGNCCLENGYNSFWDSAPTKGNLNLCTISIEHCSGTPSGDNSDPCTPQQEEASFRLVAYLAHKYHVGMDHIKGHNTIDPIDRKNCPGNYPWNSLFAYLEGEGMTVPAGWNDNGTKLTSPNGHYAQLGMRNYILNNPWDSDDWLLTEEIYTDNVEESNNALGAGSYIVSRKHRLEFTKSNNSVFLGWLGQEYLFVKQDRDTKDGIIAQLQEQIKTLQTTFPTIDAQDCINSIEKLLTDLKSRTNG